MAAAGGWGRGVDPARPAARRAPAGSGTSPATATWHLAVPGHGRRRRWFGGGAAGGARGAGGVGGGSYGAVRRRRRQRSARTGDGSIVVEITTPPRRRACRPLAARDEPGDAGRCPRAGVVGGGRRRRGAGAARSLPAPPSAAASGRFDGDGRAVCPGVMSERARPAAGTGTGGVLRVVDPEPASSAARIDTPADGTSARRLARSSRAFGTIGNVAVGSGPGRCSVARTGQQPERVFDPGSPVRSVTMTGPFASGAVLEAGDALKLFNECPGCDLYGCEPRRPDVPAG